MMQGLKEFVIILLSIIIFGSYVWSCCDEEPSPVERLRPTLSTSTLKLEVGDSAVIHVSNTELISSVTITSTHVISLQVKEFEIIVKALAKGNAIIDVNADGVVNLCKRSLCPSGDGTAVLGGDVYNAGNGGNSQNNFHNGV